MACALYIWLSKHSKPARCVKRTACLTAKKGEFPVADTLTVRHVKPSGRACFPSVQVPPPVRVRFAPSPTGLIHIGNVRTALFNWLFARHTGGKLILRVEDTDAARNTAEATQLIYDTLQWMGIDWDEGPGVGGEFGPYRQSERGSIYQQYLDKLVAAGRVYEDHGTMRFRSERKPVVVDDLICGHIEFDRSNDPDMTIQRPDGSWIFHFVNVVDDIEMQISHVIRGEDHLSNTPKHVEIYQALGVTPPKFAHIPLILNVDGSKMSKRDAGARASSYIEEGYVPEAFVNYLCLLNWSPKDNREKIDIAEVVKLFELTKINRGNAAFDTGKLFWLNGQYVRDMSLQRFHELSVPWFERAGVAIQNFSEDYVLQVLAAVKEKVKLLKDVPVWTASFFTDAYSFDDEGAQKVLKEPGVTQRLTRLAERFETVPEEAWNDAVLEAALKELSVQEGAKTAAFIHPLRVALSGRTVGPSIYSALRILGRTKVLDRLRRTTAQFA